MGFILCFPSLYFIFEFVLASSLGITFIPVPSWTAVLWALAIGAFIPIISSIIPLKVVLSKNLNDALDYSHSKTKANYVKILKTNEFDRMPYLVFGALSIIYGVSIYYLMPYALLSLNLGLLLNIFFMILIGMLFGLTLLSINLQRILEIVFTYVFLFYERKSMKLMILKNLVAHWIWNRLTILIFALSIGFIILCVVAYKLEIINIKLMTLMNLGSNLRVSASDNSFITPT